MTTESSQPVEQAPQSAPEAAPASGNQNQLRIAILVVVAALVGVGLWLALSKDDTKKNTGGKGNGNLTTAIGPKSLTAGQLRNQASHIEGALYWIGPKKNYRYEFTRTTNGRLFVRYLPAGVKNDTKKGQLLIVATYPYPHPYAALKEIAKGRGVPGPGGSIIIPARVGDSNSILMAWPHGSNEVEVYSPKAGKAKAIAGSGSLATVG